MHLEYEDATDLFKFRDVEKFQGFIEGELSTSFQK